MIATADTYAPTSTDDVDRDLFGRLWESSIGYLKARLVKKFGWIDDYTLEETLCDTAGDFWSAFCHRGLPFNSDDPDRHFRLVAARYATWCYLARHAYRKRRGRVEARSTAEQKLDLLDPLRAHRRLQSDSECRDRAREIAHAIVRCAHQNAIRRMLQPDANRRDQLRTVRQLRAALLAQGYVVPGTLPMERVTKTRRITPQLCGPACPIAPARRTALLGEHHTRSPAITPKLSEADVVEIRNMRRTGASYREIARKFGIHPSYSETICKGKNRKNVPMPQPAGGAA